jgi:hypothetical protein
MKILISITQNVDATKESITAQHKGLGTSTEAGPFKTREEALNWQNFMMSRRDNYVEFKSSSPTRSDAYWFGITVESLEVH